MAPQLTVVIPAFNSSESLIRTLGFLQRENVRVPIIVADGSDKMRDAKVNSECKRLGDNISYFHFSTGSEDPIQDYFRRVNSALDQVTTPYVVFCGDDDIVVLPNALKSAKFLDDNSGYVACHGSYLLFRYAGDAIQIEDIAYEGTSIDGDEVGARIMQLFARYEAPYYAVYRTSVQRKLLLRCLNVDMPLWPETYHSTAAVIEGKIKRLDNIHCLRNIGIAPHHIQAIRNFGRWAATDLDGFFDRYRKFRSSAVGWAKERPDSQIGEDQLRSAIDMAFMLYIGREFDPTYWIDRYLETAIVDGSEKARLRARMEPILFGREARGPNDNEKLAILPFGDAFRSLIISTIRLLVGENGIRMIQLVKRKGIRGAIMERNQSDVGWVQADGVWVLAQPAGAEQCPKIEVAGFLRRRYSQEQWDLLRKFLTLR